MVQNSCLPKSMLQVQVNITVTCAINTLAARHVNVKPCYVQARHLDILQPSILLAYE